MSYKVINEAKIPIKAWTNGVQFEDDALKQAINIANMPFVKKHVAIMPDVHWGIGATVGSVIATKGAVIPAAVGVDIGCGMVAQRTTLTASDLPDNLRNIRTAIEIAVPHGRTNDGGPGDRGAFGTPRHTEAAASISSIWPLVEKYPRLEKPARSIANHAGTLGTGNHFIELCLDEEDYVWVMLHSGSRGIGNAIGKLFIELAKKDMERWFINLPDKNLAYFPQDSNLYRDYMLAVEWAQDYAALNRRLILRETLIVLGREIPKAFELAENAINCHHNYVTWENHFNENLLITRKGAVCASPGKLGIIPGSMGTRSYIVSGKGNKDSFNSCSHGAGRVMSRNQARKQFTIEDHINATYGIECRKDEEVIDETPGAYKNIDHVMEAQKDLVDIKYTLRQMLCVKG